MSRFRSGLSLLADDLKSINPQVANARLVGGKRLVGISPRFRFYLPHKTFVEAGLGYIRSSGSLDVQIGDLPASFSYTNYSVEIPILFGVHLAQVSRSHLYAALGPTLLIHSRSDWTYDRGYVSDFESSRGGGIELMVGGDLYVRRGVSITMALRYRFLRSGALHLVGERYPPVPTPGELDYSGISATMGVRWHSF